TTAAGVQIGNRGGHSAVLTQDSKIIVYGGSTTNIGFPAIPDLLILDTNLYPFDWIVLEVSTNDAAPPLLLTEHFAAIYDDFMIIAFGRFTVPNQESLSNSIYIYDTQNNLWVTTLIRDHQTSHGLSNFMVVIIVVCILAVIITIVGI
ncbi:19063_t:CDS:2, partial [Dentiscutata erythropus]